MSSEILSGLIEICTGSIDTTTFWVSNSGRNYAKKRIKKGDGDGNTFFVMAIMAAKAKYRWISETELEYWQSIAKEKTFWSEWQAFVSSFFVLAKELGITTALYYEPFRYREGPDRTEYYMKFARSYQRRMEHKQDSEDHDRTHEILDLYKDKVELLCPAIEVKLRDCFDIIEAITDGVIVYKERTGYGTGGYGRGNYGVAGVEPIECMAEVVSVIDGDTVRVAKPSGDEVVIRLSEVDCPETYTDPKQPYGTVAANFVKSKIAGRQVVVIPSGYDMYGRLLAHILYTETARGYGTGGYGSGVYGGSARKIDLNRKLVEEGLAWWNDYYSDDYTMKKLMETAMEEKRGLWADDDPIAPWDWRWTH